MTRFSAHHPAADIPAVRYAPAVATAVIGVVVSFVAYLSVENSQARFIELNLADLARNYQQTLNADLERASSLLYTLRDYFESSERPVARSEYQAFAKNLRGRVFGLRDTGWAPRVAAGERDAFEHAVRDSGFPDFEIWEHTGDGKRVRAGDRAEYYPLLYPDPVDITPQILGFDLMSEKNGVEALRAARETGGPAATAPLDLFVGQGKGFLSCIPVYDKAVGGNGEPRRIMGFVNAVFAISPMFEKVVAPPAGLDVYVFDPDGPSGDRLIYWHSASAHGRPAPVPSELSLMSGPHWHGTLRVADRTWGVIFASTDEMFVNSAPWVSIATLSAGLAMTAMIVAYLLVKLWHTLGLESLTASLKAANDDLLALRAAFNQLDIGIVLLDRDLRAQFINQRVRREWSLSDQQVEAKPTFESLIHHGLDGRLFAKLPADPDAHVASLVARMRSEGAISEDFELTSGEVVRFRSVVSPDGGRMLSSSNVTDLVRQAEQLRALANIDAMTGAANRRHFVERAEAEWRRFARHGYPLSLLAIDIDMFKSINDRFGHDVGDEVIRAVALTCASAIRDCDMLGRMGGEEFAILLPHADLESAAVVAERIRRQIDEMRLRAGDRTVSATVSIGVAQADAAMGKIGVLLKRADEALYAAKRNGRNCVIRAVGDVGIEPHSASGASMALGTPHAARQGST